ncbi:MAG: hypothetical protein GX432_11965 [Candidatus Atribacteria bacterium]|nr:hypothetical protein [Candidatus Atribacteria bacterium]
MGNVKEVCCLRFPIPIANFIMEKGVKEGCKSLIFKDMGDGTAEIIVDHGEVDKLLFCELKGR